MEKPKYFGIMCCLVLISCTEDSYGQSYKAGVVAFRPEKGIPRSTTYQVEENNTHTYIQNIKDLGDQGVDIVVFPEKGITTLNPDKHATRLDLYSIDVPEPSAVVNFSNKILSEISTAAKINQVYVVINVLEGQKREDKSEDYFSTDLVFDKEGKLVLKCRKPYLYGEKLYNKSEHKELCSFKADFSSSRSVSFALLFDTDMLSHVNDSIYNAISTSSLPNKLPLFFGLSLQVGFSVRNQINLLVSGYTDPNNGYGGSGIYFRNGTSKVTIGGGPFTVADVPITQNREKEIDVKVVSLVEKESLKGISYEELNTSALSNKVVKIDIDKNGGYCDMKIDINGNNIHPYKWIAFSGKMEILKQQQDVSLCALIKPKENINQTGIVNGVDIVISKKGTIRQILPVSLHVRADSTWVPANFHYKEEKNDDVTTATMKLTEKSDLAGFGIIISHGTSIHVTYMVLIGSLIFISYFRSRFFI